MELAHNKELTATLLRQAGFPAATHLAVGDAEQAVTAARQIGYPVVVKPGDQERGIGVAAHLVDEASVRAAYQRARQHSSHILVERHVHGKDYRLTVLNGRLIKTVYRRPGGIVGDGQHSIEELLSLHQPPYPWNSTR